MTTKRKAEKKHLTCPFCDQEVMKAAYPFCKTCDVTTFTCPECHASVPRGGRDGDICPHCGTKLNR